jgi:hypothetical protein
LGILVSCDDLYKTAITVDFDYNKMNSEKILWSSSSKPDNYQYNLSNSGGGEYIPIKTLIIVANGQFKEQKSDTEYSAAGENYQTIDKIYETIEKIYKEYNNTEQSKRDFYLTKIKIEYDEEKHIPIRIDYYYYVPEGVMDAGEHWIYEIENFRINNN